MHRMWRHAVCLHFSRKWWVIDIWYVVGFLCTPTKDSQSAKLMRSWQNTLYVLYIQSLSYKEYSNSMHITQIKEMNRNPGKSQILHAEPFKNEAWKTIIYYVWNSTCLLFRASVNKSIDKYDSFSKILSNSCHTFEHILFPLPMEIVSIES